MEISKWVKPYKRYVLNNLDAYYFAINTFFEFPEIEDYEVRQLVYDEFGFVRFHKNTFMLSVLVTFAENKYKALAQIYASER